MSFQAVVPGGDIAAPPGAISTEGTIHLGELLWESEVVGIRLELRENRVDVLFEITPRWGLLLSLGEVRSVAFSGDAAMWSVGPRFHRFEFEEPEFDCDESGLRFTLRMSQASLIVGFGELSLTEGVGPDPMSSVPPLYSEASPQEIRAHSLGWFTALERMRQWTLSLPSRQDELTILVRAIASGKRRSTYEFEIAGVSDPTPRRGMDHPAVADWDPALLAGLRLLADSRRGAWVDIGVRYTATQAPWIPPDAQQAHA